MKLLIKKTVTKVENLRAEEKEVNVCIQAVNVEVNTGLSVCSFWAEGREDVEQGNVYELKQFVFQFDKEKELSGQMYEIMKKEWPDSVDM